MAKKTVPIAKHQKSKNMVLQNKIDNVLDVFVVPKLLFGKKHSTKNIANNIGFNCGSKKVTPYDSWLKSQAIASQNLNGSKIIGLIKHPTKPSIMEHINT
jgi:hypothetical protein